ncbi:hypothetical protein Pth03_19100 [Planotetraspora thailandica]|uniref:DUF4082 domain-containing protein n=1 Tax=Planotetraspora thailandica TaxID=487172 RepID=A0A8J3V1W9_9ACTN|nr:DUF4082 domain-containing protein [Planotetraspora thailandica]GII53521.1 hypothetical protein Pth03_19100 [Planotetraspora thailandica]
MTAGALLGATATVVVLTRDDRGTAPPTSAPKTRPVMSEVTLESSIWSGAGVKVSQRSEKASLELGTRFSASRDGVVTGMRFYKAASERGTHRGSLWDSGHKLLAQVTFTGETGSGWQEAMFSKPVPIRTGRDYTVSYHTRNGGYVVQRGVFAKPITSGPLTAKAGVYSVAKRTSFPSHQHPTKVSYFVDVIFQHREVRYQNGQGSQASPTPTPPARPSASPTPTRRAPSTPPKPPASSGPTKQPTSPGGSWPSASTTGVPSGVKLDERGSITVTKDGTVIDGQYVRGEINVDADNVTIRNTRVAAAPGDWGIIQRSGHRGLTVEDSEVYGNGKQRTQFGILNQGGDLTVRRVDIHTISNGILTEQGLIEDSYIHDPVYYSGDHTDMIMCTSGPPSGAKLVIRGNTVINTLDQTGAVALFQDFGVVRNVTVEGNFLAGGGYTVYGGGGDKGTSSNIKIVNNVFSRKVWSKGGYFGPVAHYDDNGSGNVWSGNKWENGSPVSAG